jgi:hypothetical protein
MLCKSVHVVLHCGVNQSCTLSYLTQVTTSHHITFNPLPTPSPQSMPVSSTEPAASDDANIERELENMIDEIGEDAEVAPAGVEAVPL